MPQIFVDKPDTQKRPSQRPQNLPLNSAETAYVLFTSGSSGKPKGVVIAHSSAIALLSWAQKVFSRSELTAVFAATSICFDLSVFEIFLPLSVGGKIVLAENALEISNRAYHRDVTLLNTVPSAFREILLQGNLPDTLTTVNLAGEALPLELVRKGYKVEGIQKIYNLYGPSEDTTYSSYYLVPRNETRPPAIGKPIDNTQIYILDQEMQPVPIGVSGEICIAGHGLAKGYLHQDALTRERFIANPFATDSQEKMYRTGDLGRFRTDGNIEYLGRSDFQVKLRGFRIELGEIETLLGQAAAVAEVAVKVETIGIDNQILVAYMTSPGDSKPEIESLHTLLRKRLPDYMIPAKFFLIDSFPLTPNGKIDRECLILA